MKKTFLILQKVFGFQINFLSDAGMEDISWIHKLYTRIANTSSVHKRPAFNGYLIYVKQTSLIRRSWNKALE